MTSIDQAFPAATWESEYRDAEARKRSEKQREMEAKLLETFGFSMSDFQPRHTSGVITNDGTTHYIHKETKEKYGYVYAFGEPRWKKMENRSLKEKCCQPS